ncbi:MAG: immunoglobulin domain-containing protein, partial [Limisphaerales bacterium]
MKKSLSIAIAIAAIAGNTALSQVTGLNAGAGMQSFPVPQPQYPFIILQPNDQCLPIGSDVTFTVTALNADGYQWLRNGNAMEDATNSTLVIQNAGIQNVSYYSCDVFNGMQSIPTRSALLQVYTNWIDPKTGVDPMVVYSFPYPGGGGKRNTCPGPYKGYATYAPGTNTWGWPIDTSSNNTVFTATDTNRTDTKIEYCGMYG